MTTKHQQERKERAAAKAERLEHAAGAHFESARAHVAGIEPGQPILVGHHSEKRHRRDLARSDAAMRKGVEATREAEQARFSAVRAGSAVLSDDPEALTALQEKLAKLEEQREMSKRINRAWRRGGEAALREDGISERLVAKCVETMRRCSWLSIPLDTANLSANIRGVKARIAELEAEAERPRADSIQGDGWRIEEDADDCRVRFIFDARTAPETHEKMRRAGFVFSRRNGAYQRKLNANGRAAARRVAHDLFGWEEGNDGG